MGTGGGSGPDYRPEIDKALNQANQPKSDLSQAFSGLAQGALPDLFSTLMNTQSLGNSFLSRENTSNGRLGTPGVIRPGPLNFNPRTFGAMSDAQAAPSNNNDRAGAFSFNFNGGGGINNNGTSGAGNQDPRAGATSIPTYAEYQGNAPTATPAQYQDYVNRLQSNTVFRPLPGGDIPVSNPGTGNNNGTGGIGSNGTGANIPLNSSDGSSFSMNLDLPSGGNSYGTYNPMGVGNDASNPNYNAATQLGSQIANSRGGPQDVSSALTIPAIAQALNNFQGLNMSGLNQNAMNTLGSSVYTPTVNSYNPSAALMDQNGQSGIPNLSSAISQSLSGGLGYQQGAGNGMTNGLNTNPLSNYNPANDQGFQAINQALNNKFNKDEKDLQESFTGTGTGNSTGATYGQAQLRGQELPQLQSALANYMQQSQNNQINNAQVGNNALLQNQSQGNQFQQGNAGINNNLLSTLFSGGLGQGGLLANLAQNAGSQSLGLQSLGSNNQLASQQLAQQGANSLLGQQNQFLGNQNQAIVGQNQNLNSLNQFNTGQTNSQNLAVGQMNQQAQQTQIAQQLQAILSLFSAGGSLAGAGIPGGSANVNVSNQVAPSGSGLGGTLGGLGSLLGGLGSFL